MSKMRNSFAVIFDMDGVLLDTEPLHSKSLERILLEHEKTPQFNNQGLLHTVGLSGDHIYETFIKQYSLSYELESFKKKRREIFLEIIQKEAGINRGVLPLLKRLEKTEVPIGIGSNRNISHITAILETLKIRRFFKVVVGPSEKLKYKPAPDIYLEAAKQLTISPKDAIVIEDSEVGVASAYAAGMKIIAIPNQYTNHHDFSKANRVVENFDSITLSLLQSL